MREHSMEVSNHTGELGCSYWATCLSVHLRAPLRSLILWLARFTAFTQSLPSLRKDMSLRLFLTIVRSRCANYRQTSLRTGGQTDGQTLFRWVHKYQKSKKLLLEILYRILVQYPLLKNFT